MKKVIFNLIPFLILFSCYGDPDLVISQFSATRTNIKTLSRTGITIILKNQGNGIADASHYYFLRSDDPTITTNDTIVFKEDLPSLRAGGSLSTVFTLGFNSLSDTDYYGVCVDTVPNETFADNNCSKSIAVTVNATNDHGNSRSASTTVVSGEINHGELSAGDVDYFRFSVAGSGVLRAYTTGNINTVGSIENENGLILASNDNDGDNVNFDFSVNIPNSGYYYIKVSGQNSFITGSYRLIASFFNNDSKTPDLIIFENAVYSNIINIGEVLNIQYKIKNQGSGNANSTRFYGLLPDNEISIHYNILDALESGQTSTPSYQIDFIPISAGTYYVGACVNTVHGEVNTNNNCISNRITVISGSELKKENDPIVDSLSIGNILEF